MNSKLKIIAIAVGICLLVAGALLPYRGLDLLFGIFMCCIGLMFWCATVFGRRLTFRIRLGAFIFGAGIIALSGAHIAKAIGLPWATPTLRQRIFIFGFLPSCLLAAILLPRRLSVFPPHDPTKKAGRLTAPDPATIVA